MGCRIFRSGKSINSWLDQRKVIMYSVLGFHYLYKRTKSGLYTYKPSTNTWVQCANDFFKEIPDDSIPNNYYTGFLKDTLWLRT